MLRNLYRSISAFFDKVNPAGRPRFKSRKTGYATTRWTRNGFAVSGSGTGINTDDRRAARVANQRADFHHKAARGLVASYDRIGVEDLAVKNMSAKGTGRHKAGLNRSIADAGWRQFRALAWQATKAGKTLVVLPARDTTQRCSSCGTIAKPRIELSERVYRCRACGLVADRDRNAARNLNPDRAGPGGGAEPSGSIPVGDDGTKPKDPTGVLAA
ncbi:MAG: RNA-guided endonuclease InsQ/TnpB family protein [Acidimicrobiales bacterium]